MPPAAHAGKWREALALVRDGQPQLAAALLLQRMDVHPPAAAAALLVVDANQDEGLEKQGFDLYDYDTGPDYARAIRLGDHVSAQDAAAVTKMARKYATQVVSTVASPGKAGETRMRRLWNGEAVETGRTLHLPKPLLDFSVRSDDDDDDEEEEEVDGGSFVAVDDEEGQEGGEEGDAEGTGSDGAEASSAPSDSALPDGLYIPHATPPAMVLASVAARDALAARHEALYAECTRAAQHLTALQTRLRALDSELCDAEARVAADVAALRRANKAAPQKRKNEHERDDSSEEEEEEVLETPPVQDTAGSTRGAAAVPGALLPGRKRVRHAARCLTLPVQQQ